MRESQQLPQGDCSLFPHLLGQKQGRKCRSCGLRAKKAKVIRCRPVGIQGKKNSPEDRSDPQNAALVISKWYEALQKISKLRKVE